MLFSAEDSAARSPDQQQETLHLPLSTLHPPPSTLQPKSYTLHHTPYTLHPTPYTPHPTPYTLHPAPFTQVLFGAEDSAARSPDQQQATL